MPGHLQPGEKPMDFGSGSPNKMCEPGCSYTASSPPQRGDGVSSGDVAELYPAVDRQQWPLKGSLAASFQPDHPRSCMHGHWVRRGGI